MKKRLLATLLSLCLLVGLLPTAALAIDEESGGDPAQVCTCTALCTEGAVDGICLVCAENYTLCEYKNTDNKDDTIESEKSLITLQNETNGILDLDDGSIWITSTGYTQGEANEIQYTGIYTISQTNPDTPTTNTIYVESGTHTIILNGVNIDVSTVQNSSSAQELCAFTVAGDNVTLKLAEKSKNTLKSGGYGTTENWAGLNAYAGLWVKYGATLVIRESTSEPAGKLVATGGVAESGIYSGGGAGIGGSYIGSDGDGSMGNITINSGTIVADGGNNSGRTGAGLGKADGDTHTNNTITINGGTVTATGYGQAAGIGGTYGAPGGTVVITGGTVIATAKQTGAGIGAGNLSSWSVVDIQGGTVTATGGTNAAGIGSGAANNYGADNATGTISISGGTVTANGNGYGAGIGGGGNNSTASVSSGGGSNSGDITISGGIVTAKGGDYAPGIGSGSFATMPSRDTNAGAMNSITLTGGTITTISGNSYSGSVVKFDEISTGIGQGNNPGSEAGSTFSDWSLDTEYGNVLQIVKKNSESSLTRNGVNFETAALTISETSYYLLPEGYYGGLSEDGTALLVATNDDKTTADSLVSNLNAVSLEEITDELINNIREYDKNYMGMSDTLRYYVDASVDSGKTLSSILESLGGQVSVNVTVTLNPDGGTLSSNSANVKFRQPFTLAIPEKDNYIFTGWYLGSEEITGADGAGESWPYINSQTLTAHWKSEIEGTGTEADPYLLKSTENLVALSHISLGIYTEEELALFSGAKNIAELLDSHFKLVDDVTISTSDGFYGIGGRYGLDMTESGYGIGEFSALTGVFDGNGKTITLNVDTSTLAESEGEYAGQVKISQGQENPVYLEITGGLFNRVAEGTIQNLIIEGSVKLLFRSSFAGVFAGQADNSAFINCTNSASLTVGSVDDVSSTTWSGGIVGYASGNGTTKFQQCINNGNIYAGSFAVSQGNSAAAGICAYSGAKNLIFENCVNTGELSATRQHQYKDTRYTRVAGILSATANGTKLVKLSDCKNYGGLSAVAGNNNAGAGICLAHPQTKLELSNCENYGTVTALGLEGRACLLSGCSDFTVAEIESVTYNNCYHVMSGSGDLSGYRVGSAIATYNSFNNQTTVKVPVTTFADNHYIENRYVEWSGKKVADICSADNTHVFTVLPPKEEGGGSTGGGSTTTTYPITVEDSRNGEVDSNRTRASSGATVTLTVTPDKGYELDELTVTDKNGKAIKLTDKGDGKYTFTMPRSAVTVEATFRAVEPDTPAWDECGRGPDCPAYHFTDLNLSLWYHDGIHFCVEHGLMNGTSATTFEPDTTTSRGMIVTILYRLEGTPAVGASSFTDVAAGAYYADAVAWANANGIVMGYGNGKYGPDDPVTREQLAAILYRYAQYKGYDTTQGGMSIREFSDYEQISDYALEPMTWAVNAGLINGITSTTLAPTGSGTRAQTAALLMRFCENIAK